MSTDEIKAVSKRSASRRTRHLLSLNGAADTLDLNIAQAQIMAGIPAVPKAAELLDDVVIPAYARARLSKSTVELTKLLAVELLYRGRTGPNCALSSTPSGGDANVWNTLCAMEANPTFARNVVRALVARRLDRHGASYEAWRRAIRSPLSGPMLDIIGHDVILRDAGANLPDSTLGVWAIELPRIYADPLVPPLDAASPSRPSCWEAAAVPRLLKDDGQPDLSKDYYALSSSGRCVLLDPFNAESFTAMSFQTRFHALMSERTLVTAQLRELCASNPLYPEAYCTFGSDDPSGGKQGTTRQDAPSPEPAARSTTGHRREGRPCPTAAAMGVPTVGCRS